MAKQIIDLLREARITLEMWKDVAPAVSLCADIDAALLAAAPAPIQQGQLVEVGQMIEFDDYEDPRFHTIMCDWDNEARAKLTAGTKIYAVSAGSQVQAAGDAVQCTLGVGSGNGNLFVVGDYDSIKAAQAWILRATAAESRLAEIQRASDKLIKWETANGNDVYDADEVEELLALLKQR